MEEYISTSSVGTKKEYPLILDEENKLRRDRFVAVLSLLICLFVTLVFGTLKNPFEFTFSKIGNYFNYRGWYIAWAVTVGICIQTASFLLFRLCKYTSKLGTWGITGATFFLIVTAIIPSLKEQMPFLHALHKWTTFFYVMSMITGIHPFLIYLGRKIPRLKVLLRNWQLIILTGSMTSLIIQGQTGIFELWFFITTCSLLIYLSGILFGEALEIAAEKRSRNENYAYHDKV